MVNRSVRLFKRGPVFIMILLLSNLLVTRPSKSRALECFVVDVAQQSTHTAMLVGPII